MADLILTSPRKKPEPTFNAQDVIQSIQPRLLAPRPIEAPPAPVRSSSEPVAPMAPVRPKNPILEEIDNKLGAPAFVGPIAPSMAAPEEAPTIRSPMPAGLTPGHIEPIPSPISSELSPAAQQAIALSGITQPLPAAPTTAAATSNSPALAAPPMAGKPLPNRLPLDYPAQQSELARLTQPPLQGPLAHTKADTGLSGIGQIHSKPARIGLSILDALGSTFLPGLTMMLPGTQLHHQLLVGARENTLNQATKRNLEQSQAEEMEARALKERTPPVDEYAELKELATDPANPQIGPQAAFFNKRTGQIVFGDVPAAPKPENDEFIEGKLPEVDPANQQAGPQAVFYNKRNPSQKRYGAAPVVAPPKQPSEAETPLGERVSQLNQALLARYRVLHPETKTLPAEFALPANAVQADFQRIDKVLEAEERAISSKDQRDQANEMRKQTIELARERMASAADNAGTRSYQFHTTKVDAAAKPIEDAVARLSRLQETLRQGTPQADALVAPELLTVMAGGAGSGLRMNEAEIGRIVGGRSHWENLRAAIQKWSIDPKSANGITPDQRQQIRALVTAVSDKLTRKQAAIGNARERLFRSNDSGEHKAALNDLHKELTAVDSGEAAAPEVGDTREYNGDTYTFDGSGWVKKPKAK